MSLQTFEGIVENGQIRLRDQVTLPEQTTVYVVVPEQQPIRRGRIFSPRLTRREDAARLAKKVIELPVDAEL